MSKERAFVRYTKAGKIVPGSLILTGGSYPSGPGLWKEITTDLCCENQETMNYKIYRAILFQDGTASAPTAYVLENTLGTTPVWTYVAVGGYNTDLGLGTLDHTKVHSLCTLDPNSTAYWAWIGINSDPPLTSSQITLLVYIADPSPSPSELGGYCSIEIKVYP